jgi:microsomal dipeptidase-like Zn-dependent dipeptidase
MAKMGMMIDIAHASPETVRDILKEVAVPIYDSHTCVYAINPHWRNLRDWEIKSIAERGGVIGVNFYSKHLRKDGKPASATDVARHIDYIVKLVGIDYVAIGSDFDGDIKNTKRLENISKMQSLTEELVRRGYSDEDIGKVLGGNFLRFFKKICP